MEGNRSYRQWVKLFCNSIYLGVDNFEANAIERSLNGFKPQPNRNSRYCTNQHRNSSVLYLPCGFDLDWFKYKLQGPNKLYPACVSSNTRVHCKGHRLLVLSYTQKPLALTQNEHFLARTLYLHAINVWLSQIIIATWKWNLSVIQPAWQMTLVKLLCREDLDWEPRYKLDPLCCRITIITPP